MPSAERTATLPPDAASARAPAGAGVTVPAGAVVEFAGASGAVAGTTVGTSGVPSSEPHAVIMPTPMTSAAVAAIGPRSRDTPVWGW